MTNFKNVEIGTMAELGKNYENGKAFLHDLLELTSCEISVSSMPAGIKLPFNHKHIQNEEIYIFLKQSEQWNQKPICNTFVFRQKQEVWNNLVLAMRNYAKNILTNIKKPRV